jgi:hypothetical protein
MEAAVGKRPLGIIVLAAYLAITGVVGLILLVAQLFAGLTLKYINGFLIFALVLYLVMIIPALLSIAASYRVWRRQRRAVRLATWAMSVRIFLAILPPGFSGPLGVGILSVPFDAAMLVYGCTSGVRAYFAARGAEVIQD